MAANLAIVIKAHDQAGATLDSLNKKAGGLGKTFGTVLKVGALGAAAGIAASIPVVISAVQAASSLNEAVNKSAVTFGKSIGIVSEFADTSARKFGISERAANEYAGTLGVILQASGLSQEATAGMSVDLTKLAADLASFNNIPIDEALEKIRSGLVGEAEPLRTVGVLLSEAAVQQKAVEMGLAPLGAKLTDAQKVQARYAIIIEQTSKAQGDFERTSDSLANRQRILSARFEDLRARLGQKLLPVAVKFFGLLLEGADVIEAKVIPKLEHLGAQFRKDVQPTLQEVGATLRKDVLPHVIGFGKAAATVGAGVAQFLLPSLDTLRDAWVNIGRPLADLLLPLLERLGRFLLEHKEIVIAVAAAILLITNPWLAVVAVLAVVLAKWDEISALFTQTIPAAIDSLIKKVQSIPIIGAIFTDTMNTAKAIVETVFKLIVNRIEFALDSIKNAVAFWKAIFSGDWKGAWDAVRAQAGAVWKLIKGDFGALLDGFVALLSSKIGLLKGVGAGIASLVAEGFNAGLVLARGAINGLISIVEKGLNLIIDKWNGVEFKLPSVNIPGAGKIGGQTISLPDLPRISIPRLEAGGEVLRTGLAVVHRGERFSGVGAPAFAGVTINISPGGALIGTVVADGDLGDPVARQRFTRNVQRAIREVS